MVPASTCDIPLEPAHPTPVRTFAGSGTARARRRGRYDDLRARVGFVGCGYGKAVEALMPS